MQAAIARAITEVITAYKGSNGDVTRALYSRLLLVKPHGPLAVDLLRAVKNSERAKVYRGRGYRDAAYDRKQWAMGNLCRSLASSSLTWGWGIDEKQQKSGAPHFHVLYVEIETGQVSFHTDHRGDGPDYPGQWDGMPNQSADRICRWAGQVLAMEHAEAVAS